MFVLFQLCLYLYGVTHCGVCDVSSAVQRIVACILQNAPGCSRTSWYFWQTAFHILPAGICKTFCRHSYQYSGVGIGMQDVFCFVDWLPKGL